MRVCFRADGSILIGTGHVMRCLTLADALKDKGADCWFICRTQHGHLIEHIMSMGYQVHELQSDASTMQPSRPDDEQDDRHEAAWLGCDWGTDALQTEAVLASRSPDWLVVDHYGLDARWESSLRRYCRKLLVIDDLANRRHDCDLLLDQNLGRTATNYQSLVPETSILLLGPQFALLRPQFAMSREYSLRRRADPAVKHLLITMGGVDRLNATGQVLESLAGSSLPPDCKITLVMGANAPWLDLVRKQAARMAWNIDVLVDVKDMATVMADSDLAIGAAGSTSWERCCLGLPSLMVILAENQRRIASELANFGAAVNLGVPLEPAFVGNLQMAVDKANHNSTWLSSMSERAATVADGAGAGRVADFILEQA